MFHVTLHSFSNISGSEKSVTYAAQPSIRGRCILHIRFYFPFAARVAFGSSSVINIAKDTKNFDDKLQAQLSDDSRCRSQLDYS